MSGPRIVPALADLTQDIAGPVPVRLLLDWASGRQDPATAQTLLGAFEVGGIVVASDTSGLSRMTHEQELLDVLGLISQPKEIVHALGRQAGGRAVGRWVADNTEMIYPEPVEAARVVGAMSEAQFRIGERLPLRIGMCVHVGRFYEIGGGLYGTDASAVEHLAESYAQAGEILVTEEVRRLLSTAGMEFKSRGDLAAHHPPGVYALAECGRSPQLMEEEREYPHAFPQEFFKLLRQLGGSGDSRPIKEYIHGQWLRDQVIVFVSRKREAAATDRLAGLLDNLVENALVDTVLRQTMHAERHIAESGGGLAILTFDGSREALDFAFEARQKFTENGLSVQIGVDRGQVLLFRGSTGPTAVAGDAVNRASKLSEDVGPMGSICATGEVLAGLQPQEPSTPFRIRVSGVEITGGIF